MAKDKRQFNIVSAVSVRIRRIGFSVRGFINNPPSFWDIKSRAKALAVKITENPKKYIPAAKIACFLLASAVYLTAALFAGAAAAGSSGTVSENSGDVFGGGFVTGNRKSAVSLNWEDGILELVNGTAHAKLTAEVSPKFLERAGIVWTSSDEKIATVSKDGSVTAKKAGTVCITAAVKGGNLQATAKLRVLQGAEALFMTTSNVTLYTGGTGQYLRVAVFPEDAEEAELEWKSLNEKVVTVSSTGHIKPVGVGMTEVTASTKDGTLSCKSFVTVVNYTVKVDGVSIENESPALAVGETMNLVAAVTPYNARNKTLKWESSDENIVSVNQTGRIKGVREGTAAVSATSANGVKAAVIVTVEKSDKKNGFDLYDDLNVTVTGSGGVTYTPYDITLSMMANRQMGQSPPPQIWRNGGSIAATEAEVIEYLNPANYADGMYKYQFLDLSSPNGISAEALNLYLADKGILAGQGEAFVNAAKAYNISEVYLVAHACLETGNGGSQLSTGVNVNGVTVYNMYGIGAYDSGAVTAGSKKAYDEGWTSVEAAIDGGAEWISKYYVNMSKDRQNTLYKMLWNPENPGTHQYATDVGWAVKQARSISRIFESFPEAELSFDVPVYSGQTAVEIQTE